MSKLVTFISLLILLFITAGHLHSQSITTEETRSWYKTQVGTGIGNCGPTVVAMIIERSGPKTTVQQIRAQLPPGPANGATYNDLLEILNTYRIRYYWLNGISEWNGDGILMVAINPIRISAAPYEYNGGHYILLVGRTEENYIVNDPYANFPELYYSREEIDAWRYSYIIWIP